MHPEVVLDHPGRCPKCGMELEPVAARPRPKDDGGLDKHAGHSVGMFARRFWVCLALTAIVVPYSGILRSLFGFTAPVFPGSEFLPPVIGTVVFFYGGLVFIRGAYRELRARLPGMMTLISLAITVAYVYSLYSFWRGGETLFWELTTLVTIMLLGHWIEMKAVSGAQGALAALARLLPDTAEIVRDGGTEAVPLERLAVGDVVLVRPGGKVPADGRVIEGGSQVNEAAVTGESRPVAKSKNDEVVAGTINGDGALRVEVARIGSDTFLAGVMRLVAEAQSSKSKLQTLSDRAAFYLTVVAVVSGAATLAAWLAAGAAADFALERTVSVLVVACPHALGLAIPLVASISTTMAARNGLLVRQRAALEEARRIDVVLMDKTGTLTRGVFGVDVVIPAGDHAEDETLRLAAAVESSSEHPIAKAIVAEAARRNPGALPSAEGYERLPGQGGRARVHGREVMVGSPEMLAAAGLKPDEELRSRLAMLEGQGRTVVYVVADGRLAGAVALGDAVRPESLEAVGRLKKLGLRVGMVTGDSEEVAARVAGELGIDEYFARVRPEQKALWVKQLQANGKRVAMVGDGVNDAPALAQADLGIAIGAGTNVAVESAGIILVRNDPRDIPRIIRLSRLTYAKMIQNLFWAAGYNVVALPLSAGVLASRGLLLQPAAAAVLMSLSTVIVALNALLLRRRRLD